VKTLLRPSGRSGALGTGLARGPPVPTYQPV